MRRLIRLPPRLYWLPMLVFTAVAIYGPRLPRAGLSIERSTLLRIQTGDDSESDRRVLAAAVTEACGLGPLAAGDDPFILRADMTAGPGLEMAVAFSVSPSSGVLALLELSGNRLHLAACLKPDQLGVPTSLAPWSLPGRRTAVVLTDYVDQMSGAFTRRENCSVLEVEANKSEWRRIWSRCIESESYWNRAWEQPPGRGWLRLAGTTQCRLTGKGKKRFIIARYRNVIMRAAGAANLPEAGEFELVRSKGGELVYRWDPGLGLFVLGYGKTLHAARLLTNPGGRPAGPCVAAGTGLAILEDDAGEPRSLIETVRFLLVAVDGRVGFLPADEVQQLNAKPLDLTDRYQSWGLRPGHCSGQP